MRERERERGLSNNLTVWWSRFIRSYLRFAPPNARLEEVASDAGLQEKSLSELQRLADCLHEGVEQAETQHREREEGEKGPLLQLSGVSVPVQSFRRRLEELQALSDCLPAGKEARKRYRMVTRAKPVTWPRLRWAPVDDSRLLVGVLKHGIGNWDSIRDDPDLNMGSKVSDPFADEGVEYDHTPSDSAGGQVSEAAGLSPADESGVSAEAAGGRGQGQPSQGLPPPQLRGVADLSPLQGGRGGRKGAAAAKPVQRAARKRKPVSKPVKPPPRTGQTSVESLTVQIPRELLMERSMGVDKTPAVKRPKVEPGRGRVSSFSEEDWEERELDDEVFKRV